MLHIPYVDYSDGVDLHCFIQRRQIMSFSSEDQNQCHSLVFRNYLQT